MNKAYAKKPLPKQMSWLESQGKWILIKEGLCFLFVSVCLVFSNMFYNRELNNQ